MIRPFLIALLSIACAAQTTDLQSKDVQGLINDGNAAAHRDDHAEAIRDYQQAIKLDPSVRDSLLLRLGQQYLWSGQSDPAVEVLREYVKKNPAECSPKSTYALALSWSNQLKEAQQTYREIQASCPDLKTDAMLGEARVLRWRDRFQAASMIYKQALKDGTPEQQNDAKLGLALTKLAQDENRGARDDFRALTSQSKPDPAAIEGLAVADLHLGMPENARRDIELGKAQNVHTQQLNDLSEHIQDLTSPTIAPQFNFFQDGDGTTYYGGEVRGSFGTFTPRSHAEAFAGASNLDGALGSIGNHWGGAAIEHRLNESVAFRAQGQTNDFSEAHFNPFTGEGNVIITPADRTRIDLAVARITIWDNQTALFNHLIGTFGSAGVDQRLTMADRISFAVDATGWSEGNMRMRYRFTPAHTFDGLPHVTISLPVLYQTYDRGFNFGLFSPRSYIELAPAIDVQFRRARVWTFDFYGRVGGQKESAVEWKPLGTFLFRVQRDLKNKWGLQGSFAHSSSNVASSSGFSRTSVSFSVVRQF
jgi:tetratricopeptide (TPR) repeat protein